MSNNIIPKSDKTHLFFQKLQVKSAILQQSLQLYSLVALLEKYYQKQTNKS